MTAAAPANAEQLAEHLWCIDTEQVRDRMACCYLIGDGQRYAFIECGTNEGVPRLLALLDALGIGREQVSHVIPTHIHLDHAGGAGLLMQSLPEARLVIHQRGARHMIDPTALARGVAEVYGVDEAERMYGTLVPIPEGTKVIKKALVGTGGAEKLQVQAMLKVLLPGVKLAGEDAADALAVAITHANMLGSHR